MTLLGKMLVFLVLILALVWNALVVNSYATRTNWKAQADKAQKSAQEAAIAAGNLRKLVDVEREASEERARVLREDNTRLYEQSVSLKKSNDEVNKAYQEQQAANRDGNAKADQLQANVNTLQKQIDVLTVSVAEKEKQIDKLIHESEASKAEMVAAQIKSQQQQRRAEQLYEQLQKLRDQVQDTRAASGGGGNPLVRTPTAPTAFRGTIRERSGDLISFTPGFDAGLAVGTTLTIQRLTGKGKYVGKLKVIQVDPKEGVGRFVPPPGIRIAPSDWPQPGDELVPD